jgi:exonuclease III
LEQLATNPKLHFLTEGQHSTNPKFKFNKSIDHIIINNVLKKYYIEGSVFQFDFNAMLSDSAAINISDHCPVFVQFDISRK